jgi:hypothetical protein
MCKQVCLLALLPFFLRAAGDARLDRETLRGLKAASVVVDPIGPELEQQGVQTGLLQSRMEEGLRAAGLLGAPGSPEFLGLRILPVRSERGPFAVCLSLGLYQRVILAREPSVKTATQTWEVETIFMAQPKVVYQASLDSVDELIQRFIEAWRSVNPK